MTPVETVARAIAAFEENGDDELWLAWLETASAAIAALSTPSDAMVEAGMMAVLDGGVPDFPGDPNPRVETVSARLTKDEARAVIVAAIAAAIKEGGGP